MCCMKSSKNWMSFSVLSVGFFSKYSLTLSLSIRVCRVLDSLIFNIINNIQRHQYSTSSIFNIINIQHHQYSTSSTCNVINIQGQQYSTSSMFIFNKSFKYYNLCLRCHVTAFSLEHVSTYQWQKAQPLQIAVNDFNYVTANLNEQWIIL